MQTSRMIISALFWALLGSILAGVIGVNPLLGALALQVMNLVPMPEGILGENAPSSGTQTKEAELLQRIETKYNELIEKATKGYLTEAQFDAKMKAMQEAMDKINPEGKLHDVKEALQKQLDEIGLAVEKIKNSNEAPKKLKSLESFVKDAFASENFKKYIKGDVAAFSQKADMTLSQVYATGTYMPEERPDVLPLPRKLHVRDVIAKGTSDESYIKFNKVVSVNAAGAAVGLDAASPQSDFKLSPATVYANRIATHLVVDKNTLRGNQSRVLSMIKNLIPEQLRDKEDYQIIKGTGVAENVSGVMTTASAFATVVASGHAMYQKFETPNKADVLKVAITILRNAGISATAIFLNPFEALLIETMKDTTKNYLKDIIIRRNEQGILMVGGIPVVELPDMASDEFLVGDFQRSLELADYESLNMRIFDQNGTDAIQNQVTIAFEMQILLPIYRDIAFLKGLFSTALTAITKV